MKNINITLIVTTICVACNLQHTYAHNNSLRPSGTLPIMHINTTEQQPITSKENYIQAQYWIETPDNTNLQPLGTQDNPLTLQIRGRGNYTWTGFDKKPYRIKLDTKQPLLGMNKSKHFALLAHADDNKAFLRNTLGFAISKAIQMPWTPEQQPIEVVLNNDYIGLYFLTETIRVDKDRVNIVEQNDNATHNDSITGGWLVEIDNYDNDPHIQITEGDGNNIIFTYKTPEILSEQQTQFLTQQMQLINQLIYQDKQSELLWQYIDIETLAKFYIIQEITDNYEAFHGSCYLYKDMGNNNKWTFGPVWDFGSTFNYNKTQFCYQGREHHMTWIPEIAKFPKFQQKVQEIWHQFAQTQYDQLYTTIDNFINYIGQAAKQDALRWPQYGNLNPEERAQQIKQQLNETETWLSKQWGKYDSQTWTVWFLDNGTPAWTDLYCYVWDIYATDYDGNVYMPLGSWCGTPMNTQTVDGTNYYTLTFTTQYPLSEQASIIFNNHASGIPDNQTDNLPLQNGAVYSREEIIGNITATKNITTNDNNHTPAYYTLQGIQVTQPQPGNIYIVRRGNKAVKQRF
ncbi:MAG: CotH kinase family protein [Paludibacter sp.]|nr:CotH kinase family protein [Bacteroidales bacterium]MCM1069336.1 CotH kinase family protein [Prevotella sp.]MCM1353856.1 CotH kinase family protein [Bacteroides sp.]MCM1442894.1 CotH kinase family protein [Muribaculum sp.]MCM1481939.1 CotH kinase family protein [Paludibacter sp.]